jgi:phage shock protein C
MTDQPLEPPEPRPEERPAAEPGPAEPPPPEPAPASSTASRQLRRSRDDRVIAGVCGGLGEYYDVDPVLIRIAALLLVFAGGAGVILYVIGWIAIPERSQEEAVGPSPRATGTSTERTSGAVALGLVFVALGAFFLADEVWPDFLSWKYVWPIALIAIGAAILLRSRR